MAFVRSYGETPSRLWVEALDEMADEEARKGLTAARRRGGAFPVNLGEFVELCGKGNRHGPRYLGVPVDRSRQLPPPKANREHVENMLARMRRTVAGAPDPAELVAAEYKADARMGGPPLRCQCREGEPPCEACIEWDHRMREHAP